MRSVRVMPSWVTASAGGSRGIHRATAQTLSGDVTEAGLCCRPPVAVSQTEPVTDGLHVLLLTCLPMAGAANRSPNGPLPSLSFPCSKTQAFAVCPSGVLSQRRQKWNEFKRPSYWKTKPLPSLHILWVPAAGCRHKGARAPRGQSP